MAIGTDRSQLVEIFHVHRLSLMNLCFAQLIRGGNLCSDALTRILALEFELSSAISYEQRSDLGDVPCGRRRSRWGGRFSHWVLLNCSNFLNRLEPVKLLLGPFGPASALVTCLLRSLGRWTSRHTPPLILVRGPNSHPSPSVATRSPWLPLLISSPSRTLSPHPPSSTVIATTTILDVQDYKQLHRLLSRD